MPPTSGKRNSNDGGDPLENNAPAYHHERSNRASFNRSSVGSGSNGDHHHRSKQPPPGGASNIMHEDATVPRPVAANGVTGHQPTPLFERLVTEEVQELKAYVRIVENQNRRLAELERVHGDLESRLEVESRGRKHLEMTLEAREREWKEKFEHLESERDHWKRVVEVEQTKNSRLIDQVVRKDQDIHRMLQRKVRLLSPSSFFANAQKLTIICNSLLHISTTTKSEGQLATSDTGINIPAQRIRRRPQGLQNSEMKKAVKKTKVPSTRALIRFSQRQVRKKKFEYGMLNLFSWTSLACDCSFGFCRSQPTHHRTRLLCPISHLSRLLLHNIVANVLVI